MSTTRYARAVRKFILLGLFNQNLRIRIACERALVAWDPSLYQPSKSPQPSAVFLTFHST